MPASSSGCETRVGLGRTALSDFEFHEKHGVVQTPRQGGVTKNRARHRHEGSDVRDLETTLRIDAIPHDVRGCLTACRVFFLKPTRNQEVS